MIYLDNAATTRVSDVALDVVNNILKNNFANPSSLYKSGLDSENLITDARKSIAKILNCTPNEIYFTSCATESNNTAIYGAVKANARAGKKIVTSAVEHSSVVQPLKDLENQGYEVVCVKPRDDGEFYADDFLSQIDDKTVLVSIIMINNEIGTIMPVEKIAKAVKQKNPQTVVHIDATQGFCKYPINLKTLQADVVTASGHKIYAPKGVGFMYIRKGTKVKPLLLGGEQEFNFRAGTENTAFICAMAKSASHTHSKMSQNFAHYRELKTYFLTLVENIPQISINSTQNCVPYIVNFSVEGIRSEIMLHFLESHEIYVSSGSACKKGAKSHVLEAMGKSAKQMDTAIRISFCPQTTKDEIEALVDKLKLGIESLIKTK